MYLLPLHYSPPRRCVMSTENPPIAFRRARGCGTTTFNNRAQKFLSIYGRSLRTTEKRHRRPYRETQVGRFAQARWRHAATRHRGRSEEHTSELQSHVNLVCRLLLEKK